MAHRNRWDERYSSDHYIFGTEPNTFLASAVASLPRGRAICLGDGEGRNGVYLAEHGFTVTAMDVSSVGMEKAAALAVDRGVHITTVVADLANYDLGIGTWDLVVCIFLHLPPALRTGVHQRIAAALAPGGSVVLEAYTPRQLQFGTGGPSQVEWLMTPDILRHEFAALTMIHLEEVERSVHEGRGHDGPAAVVQLIARREQ
jgi:2-polyprenyl-3-methyl-5-hydroxy-6-metoxy-1,4-benzoquinol methylase